MQELFFYSSYNVLNKHFLVNFNTKLFGQKRVDTISIETNISPYIAEIFVLCILDITNSNLMFQSIYNSVCKKGNAMYNQILLSLHHVVTRNGQQNWHKFVIGFHGENEYTLCRTTVELINRYMIRMY